MNDNKLIRLYKETEGEDLEFLDFIIENKLDIDCLKHLELLTGKIPLGYYVKLQDLQQYTNQTNTLPYIEISDTFYKIPKNILKQKVHNVDFLSDNCNVKYLPNLLEDIGYKHYDGLDFSNNLLFNNCLDVLYDFIYENNDIIYLNLSNNRIEELDGIVRIARILHQRGGVVIIDFSIFFEDEFMTLYRVDPELCLRIICANKKVFFPDLNMTKSIKYAKDKFNKMFSS